MTREPIVPYRIRRATADDTDALYEICLRTADSGADASALYSDRRLPGYLWAAAYGALEPDFAFLLADGDRRLGYVLGTPDTAAFEERLEHDWWPKVRAGLAAFQPRTAADRMVLQRIGAPGRHDPSLLADFPAHLHINLLPEAQSGGWGRLLIAAELEALRAAGAPGVQLGVSPSNTRAMGFYEHLGFVDISKPNQGYVTYGMRLN